MTDPLDARAADDRTPVPARKPYQKPELHVYGDLATMTQSVAREKDQDGAGHPNKHFTS